MSYVIPIHHALGLLAMAAAAWIYAKARQRPAIERLALTSLPITISVVFWQLFVDIAIQPLLQPWGGARLAPAVAITYGYELYLPSGTGPVTGWLYPPGSALAYLPVAWIPNVSLCLLAGRCLTLFYFFAPVAWLLLTRETEKKWLGVQLFITFALLVCFSRPLRYAATEIHADAPALCLSALSVIVLGRSRTARGNWLAIMLAALALWAKQLAFPIIAIVIPVWAYFKGGISGLAKAGLAILIVSFALLLLFLSWIDAPDLIFNILSIPIRHPRRHDSLFFLYRDLAKLYQSHVFLIALLFVGILGLFVEPPAPRDDSPSKRGADDWRLFGLVTLAELPFALAGYIKVGGDDNNLAYFFYFLSIMCVLLLGRLLDQDQGDAPPRFSLVILAVNLALAFLLHLQLSLAMVSDETSWNQSKQAVGYLRNHPGEAYLPWHPLEHLRVDGKLYHFEYGIFDRDLAGYPVPREQFLKYIPEAPSLVCYPPRTLVGDHITLRYLDDFTRKVQVPELPDWECYARESGDDPVPSPPPTHGPGEIGSTG